MALLDYGFAFVGQYKIEGIRIPFLQRAADEGNIIFGSGKLYV